MKRCAGPAAFRNTCCTVISHKATQAFRTGTSLPRARHASAIRYIRRLRGATTTKPWITGANDTGIAAVNGNYAGEDNVSQGGVTITSLAGVSGSVAVNAATESFDEPLTSAQVVALVAPFGVK